MNNINIKTNIYCSNVIGTNRFFYSSLRFSWKSDGKPSHSIKFLRRFLLHPYQFVNLNGKAEARVLFDEIYRFLDIHFPAAVDGLNKRHDSVTIK